VGVRRNPVAARRWFEKAAAQGAAEAIHALGYALRYGIGGPCDVGEGFRLELRAARLGHFEAQFSVGVCYSRGEGTQSRPSEALRWFRRAARNGVRDAQYNLGRDLRRARSWFLRASKHEDKGVSSRARRWLERRHRSRNP